MATDSDVIDDATSSGSTALTTGNIDSQQASVTDGDMDTAVTNTINSFVNVVV